MCGVRAKDPRCSVVRKPVWPTRPRSGDTQQGAPAAATMTALAYLLLLARTLKQSTMADHFLSFSLSLPLPFFGSRLAGLRNGIGRIRSQMIQRSLDWSHNANCPLSCISLLNYYVYFLSLVVAASHSLVPYHFSLSALHMGLLNTLELPSYCYSLKQAESISVSDPYFWHITKHTLWV